MQLLNWMVRDGVSEEVIFQQNKRSIQPHSNFDRVFGRKKQGDMVVYHEQRLGSCTEFVEGEFEFREKPKVARQKNSREPE